MSFLHMLEGIRTPVLTIFFQLITYCGSELFFMAVAVTVFWCVSKRNGYYFLIVGFLGTVCSQFLKLYVRIPRPWVLDPDFTIVEAARAGATGYSFPSGHTQNIVGTMACTFVTFKNRWIRAAAVALMLLVPFSRMYLGCHTPLDVGVSFALALFLAVILRPLTDPDKQTSRLLNRFLLLSFGIAILYWAFVTFYHFPADVDAANLSSGTQNAYTLLGCLGGLSIARALDERFIHYEVDAVWWAQILKVVLGFTLLLTIRVFLKIPLRAVLPKYPADGICYLLMVLFAGAGWPLTFSWFARLGK